MLSQHVADREWGSPKTHNNYVSALREMLSYAVDHEYIAASPADKLRMLPVQRPEPAPYTVAEAQALILAARRAHGEIDELYWHLAFLLGLRPGEQISAKWLDWNKITGRLTIQRMRTEGEDKDRTKTSVVRHIDLPPAAVPLLNRLRALTALRGDFLFVDYETGEQIGRSTVMQERWALLHKIAGVSYREPYQCRHSSVSWKLMAGENWMKVAKNHGHSLATMLKTYAHWIDTDSEAEEVAQIRTFHGWADQTSLRTISR
jgi:integrase